MGNGGRAVTLKLPGAQLSRETAFVAPVAERKMCFSASLSIVISQSLGFESAT